MWILVVVEYFQLCPNPIHEIIPPLPGMGGGSAGWASATPGPLGVIFKGLRALEDNTLSTATSTKLRIFSVVLIVPKPDT